ncbi:MAG: sigma-E processing peptidase SpoIIGA [Lachnospiraceae bacterium]|nr:sigma-E processing peptidase SpoIIGA [Lachnospiraceae bacterium]
MIRYVYIDVFFIANFIMDFTLLKLLEKMRKKKIGIKRNLLASSVGSLGACFIYLLGRGTSGWLSILGVWVLCQFMIVLAYGKQNLWWNFYDALLLFTLSFVSGGIMNYLYYGTGIGRWLKEKSVFITMIAFFLFSLFSYVLIGKGIDIIRKQEKLISYKVPVIIERQGKKVKIQGYIDTGNRLYEPISHKPVILVEFAPVKSLFTTEEIEFLDFCLEQQGELGEDFDLNPMAFRLIPYQCAAGNTGFFVCVFYDGIYIGEKGEKKEKGYMALQKEKLSLEGEYEVLLHTELI